MPGSETKGTSKIATYPNAKLGRATAAKGGRIGKFGGGRTNLLEELGRVEGEHSNRNRRDEIARVHSELNKGYKKGGKAK